MGMPNGAATSPARPTRVPDAGMVFVPGTRFKMGCDHYYPEEAPAHDVSVDGFWIEPAPVTNARFAEFVAAVGYTTFAERVPTARDYPDAPPEMLRPASMVFVPPDRPVPLGQPAQWWRLVFGADWRHPFGPGSSIDGLDDHPVVHIALEDAQAYAAWAGLDLPSEAEWELAARGGEFESDFPWGREFMPNGRLMANTWHGDFPQQNTSPDGIIRTSPVGTYPPNGLGLVDMIGNVWEWTSDFYRRHPRTDPAKPCCTPHNPRVAEPTHSRDPTVGMPVMVVKGGSHLCAPNYCRRYRPAARQAHPVDTSTSHIGFRCIRRQAARHPQLSGGELP